MEMFDVEDFREVVEASLKGASVLEELALDEDGDWPIVVRGVKVYVRVFEEGGLFVHVFARIAEGVIPEAWAEINHLNKVMTWAKLVWMPNGDVVAGLMLWPTAIDAAILDHALESIATYALDCGRMLETVFGSMATVHTGPRHSPGVITSLPPQGVFVFGSGAHGGHRGGAALMAYERFGAERGVAEGLRGQSYAIPTMAGIHTFGEAAKSDCPSPVCREQRECAVRDVEGCSRDHCRHHCTDQQENQ